MSDLLIFFIPYFVCLFLFHELRNAFLRPALKKKKNTLPGPGSKKHPLRSKWASVFFPLYLMFFWIITQSFGPDYPVIVKSQANYARLAKPVIYLYPPNETRVSLTLGRPELLTCTYPHYKDKWEVTAGPDGNLIYNETGRSLYCLYYESAEYSHIKREKDGFVVKGADSASFLEEKLAILGLSPREAEEFIIYWLPRLENNPYNYIRFLTADEIEDCMPISVSPKPDSVIRILMEFEGLESPINVEEQKLTSPQRRGFTLVEWGGSEIKNAAP